MPEVMLNMNGEPVVRRAGFPPLSPALAADVEALVSVFGDHAVVVDDTFEFDELAAALGMSPPPDLDPYADVTPRCDHCGLAQGDYGSGQYPGDWNGETGCHVSCETRPVPPAVPDLSGEEFVPLVCGICREEDDAFGIGDWNPVTGEHYSCEAEDDDASASGTLCTSESCACNAPVYVPKPEDKVDPRAFVAEGVQGAA